MVYGHRYGNAYGVQSVGALVSVGCFSDADHSSRLVRHSGDYFLLAAYRMDVAGPRIAPIALGGNVIPGGSPPPLPVFLCDRGSHSPQKFICSPNWICRGGITLEVMRPAAGSPIKLSGAP